MRYASDNRFVRWFYDLTTGSARTPFIIVVVLLFGIGIYLPVRDLYAAYRTEDILRQQVAIREKYNKALDAEVDGYLSQEGVEDAARKDLGMVQPGEKSITVEGLDKDGNPIVKQPGDGEGDGSADDAGTSDSGDGSADDVGDSGDGEEGSGKLKGSDAADKNKTGSGSSQLADGDEPETSAEVEAAEQAVFENSAWYWKVLDVLFMFDGANGMAVISTGE